MLGRQLSLHLDVNLLVRRGLAKNRCLLLFVTICKHLHVFFDELHDLLIAHKCVLHLVLVHFRHVLEPLPDQVAVPVFAVARLGICPILLLITLSEKH